jgi:ribosome-associated protein
MKIISDKAQKTGKHETKEQWWADNGVEILRYPLPVGDYILVNDKVQNVLDRKAKRDVAVKKMDFLGTYDVCVDSKASIQEIINNLCGKGHDRVRDEAILAQNNGIKLYFLIEDEGGWVSRRKNVYNRSCTCVEDLFSWVNPRLWIWQGGKQKYPYATRGSTLAKTMITFADRYGCEFVFCKPKDAGKKVVELLMGENK